MKKLIMLMLVFCMASIATALPVLSVGGDTETKEFWVEPVPSAELILDVHVDPGLVGATLDIVLSNDQGSLDPSGMIFNPMYYFMEMAELPWEFPWKENTVPPSTPTYVSIGGGNFANANTDHRWVMDGLIFHCEEPTDVTIYLYAGVGGLDYYPDGLGAEDIQEGTLLDYIIVHQIPEPMTIALLSLGGLFLRRRK